jgi:glycosyltransferase involved in cell wall biosynthesis
MSPASASAAGISVVIPAYGRLSLLADLLRALAAERAALNAPSEIIVADHSPAGSAPAVAALCRSYSARYLRSRSRNPAVSRNDGAAAAVHPVVLFIDSDCVPRPGLLAAHLAAYGPAGIGGAAGPTLFTGVSGAGYRMMLSTPYLASFGFPLSGNNLQWSPSSNVSYARSVLQACGGFAETLPVNAGGEDVLLGRRVTGAGYKLVSLPGAGVLHARETWNSPLSALTRAVKWGRADFHIALADLPSARFGSRWGAFLFLFSLPAAAPLCVRFGPGCLLLPTVILAGAVLRRAMAGTPARLGPAPLAQRAGGALLMFAFDVSYLLEGARHLHPAVFMAPRTADVKPWHGGAL